MAAVPKDELAGMSSAQLDSHCQREKNDIRSILNSNQMTMTQLVKDRINVLNTIKVVGIKKEYIVDDVEWARREIIISSKTDKLTFTAYSLHILKDGRTDWHTTLYTFYLKKRTQTLS